MIDANATRVYHYIDQRSPEWYETRRGKITASSFGDLMYAKSKPADSWTGTQENILLQIATERQTGLIEDHFSSPDMAWGRQQEPNARAIYSFEIGEKVEKIGFIELPPDIGCSPDGLVGLRGMVEFKCPKSTTHLQYRAQPDVLADRYKYQVQGQLWIAERDWCDIVSYDPRFPEEQQIIIMRVQRSEVVIGALLQRLNDALEKIELYAAA